MGFSFSSFLPRFLSIRLTSLLLASSFSFSPVLIPIAVAAPDTASQAFSQAPTIEVGANSLKLPPGTKLKIAFKSALDSSNANIGDVFLAQAAEDLYVNRELILPKGTAVRGRVETVQKPGFFSKGGLLRLSFDHVVLPTGELKPMSLQLDSQNDKVSLAKNGLYTDPGVNKKLDASVDKGIQKFKWFKERGIRDGKEMGGGINMLLTVPANTLAGVAAGTGVTTANAAKAVFGKGDSVQIQPGDQFVIDFAQAVQLQAQ